MQQRVRKPHRGMILRPPGNSPSRWHLTRGFLLCCGYDTTIPIKSKDKLSKNGNYKIDEILFNDSTIFVDFSGE